MAPPQPAPAAVRQPRQLRSSWAPTPARRSIAAAGPGAGAPGIRISGPCDSAFPAGCSRCASAATAPPVPRCAVEGPAQRQESLAPSGSVAAGAATGYACAAYAVAEEPPQWRNARRCHHLLGACRGRHALPGLPSGAAPAFCHLKTPGEGIADIHRCRPDRGRNDVEVLAGEVENCASAIPFCAATG